MSAVIYLLRLPRLFKGIFALEALERLEIFFRELQVVALLLRIGERGIVSLIGQPADRIGDLPLLQEQLFTFR